MNMLNHYQIKTTETATHFDELGNFEGKSVTERTKEIVPSIEEIGSAPADTETESSTVLEATA